MPARPDPFVATLIANPKNPVLAPALANMAASVVGASGMAWLAPGVACDLLLPAGAEGRAEELLRAALGSEPVDIVVQPTKGREKRLLLADMDSTMIDQECIDELADEVGLKDAVASITARAMNGEIAFEPALRERVALLAGLDVAVIDHIVASRLTLAAGGATLVATMRARGAWTALISGGFDAFTARIAARLGFDEHRANRLVEADGRLSGKVMEPILGRAAKAAALHELCARLSIAPADALAVGDGANDLDMLAQAGAGVALHAKPAVAAQARMRIDHGDLTALLYIQGIGRDAFVR